jgi:hypothetical protein
VTATGATISGAITATSGSFTGSISASGGSIGGFTINSGSLTAGSSTNTVGLAPATYPFYAGNATAASAPFRVTPAGAVSASSITITGGSITIGANSEFSVTTAGALSAKSINVSNTEGSPGILISRPASTGDIAVSASQQLTMGHWNGTTTSADLNINSNGSVTIASGLTVTAGGLTVTAGGLTVSADGASIAGGLSGSGGITFTGASTIAGVDIEAGDVNAGDGLIKTATGITQTSGINFVNGRTSAIEGSHRYSTTANQGHYFTGIEQVGLTPAYWSANSASAYLGRTSSSIRYKENIIPVDFDIDDIVALSPVTFTIKEQYRQRDNEGNIKPAEVLLGMIAEHGYGNPAWEKLVVFSDDTGEIDAWAYQHMGVVLLSAVRQLYQKTKDLEARIAELEG